MNYKIIAIFLIAMVFSACSSGVDKKKEVLATAKKYFQPIPDKMPGSEADNEVKIALGKKLYFETALSSNDQLSCNSCHMLGDGLAGVDNKPTSEGVGGVFGGRNSPTVFNAGFHFAQFWDGRAKDLKEQAGGPVLNPVEMAMPDPKVVAEKLSKIEGYEEAFAEAFPESKNITYDNITEAIAAFERTLITHDRFDDFLKGDLKSLNDHELKGLQTFMEKSCITCHTGPLLGGHMYQKSGLVNPYKNQKDEGRFLVTKNKADKYFFKVPSLRNIALTHPYFHDGKVSDLPEVIKDMGYMQLGMTLTDTEVVDIQAFLKTLTGKKITVE